MKGRIMLPIYYYAAYRDMKHRYTHLHHGYDLIKCMGSKPNVIQKATWVFFVILEREVQEEYGAGARHRP